MGVFIWKWIGVCCKNTFRDVKRLLSPTCPIWPQDTSHVISGSSSAQRSRPVDRPPSTVRPQPLSGVPEPWRRLGSCRCTTRWRRRFPDGGLTKIWAKTLVVVLFEASSCDLVQWEVLKLIYIYIYMLLHNAGMYADVYTTHVWIRPLAQWVLGRFFWIAIEGSHIWFIHWASSHIAYSLPEKDQQGLSIKDPGCVHSIIHNPQA